MRKRPTTLWALAFLLTIGAAAYQKRTGPTHPLRGSAAIDGEVVRYKLIRSGTSGEDCAITIPAAKPIAVATLFWKRLGVDEEPRPILMRQEGKIWTGSLPSQPPAGKLEYYLALVGSDGLHLLPGSEDRPIVIRFKGAVPAYALIPHIVLMFLSLLIGLRTALAALLEPTAVRRLAWITMGCLTLGGMILGPIVQKHAFGAYWTGWPFGYDLTDNKTLIMWAAWLLGCLALGRRPTKPGAGRRAAIILAATVMIGVYLIPHSLRGSTLDYEKLEDGVPAHDAIGSG